MFFCYYILFTTRTYCVYPSFLQILISTSAHPRPPRYDNLLEVDKLAAVMNKVDSVKLVLQENVQVALANCVTLDNIEKAAGAFMAGLSSAVGRLFSYPPFPYPWLPHLHRNAPQRTCRRRRACSRRTPRCSRSRCTF